MHFKISSAICFNLDQSKILLSGKGLTMHDEFGSSQNDRINPLPNDKFLDWPKLIAFADNKTNVT